MVTAARCGFCETCFVLASVATLVQSRPFLETASKKAERSEYNPSSNFSIMGNTDVINGAISKYDDNSNNIDNNNNNNNNNNIDGEKRTYEYDTSDQKKPEKQSSTEGWCVIWYLGAFGGLVCFFLIITCMELFFRMPLYRQSHLQAFIQNLQAENKPYTAESPPPPYHLFAPPGYEETAQKSGDNERKTLDIFVIPVYSGPTTTTTTTSTSTSTTTTATSFPSVVQHV